MSTGFLALLDDISALTKAVAASLDDAAVQAKKAGAKAAGIVIDDAAVTPRYVVGFASERELPIIGRIAWGSLKNKVLFLLPGALVLSLVAPWLITPLLMAGGAFLCLEGYHKVNDLVAPHAKHAAQEEGAKPETEDEKVASAIRTDFILSAEIMAITLSAVSASPLWLQAMVLAVVGVGMTGMVYGAVALIVKADDVGVAMAQSGSRIVRALGGAIVRGMPLFLKALSLVGMVAMLWVGGGILVHGLYELGLKQPEALIKGWAAAASAGAGSLSGLAAWLVGAGVSAGIGLVVGALVDPLAKHVLAPGWRSVSGVFARKPV
jgi:predicted DNA repair protein MutK